MALSNVFEEVDFVVYAHNAHIGVVIPFALKDGKPVQFNPIRTDPEKADGIVKAILKTQKTLHDRKVEVVNVSLDKQKEVKNAAERPNG